MLSATLTQRGIRASLAGLKKKLGPAYPLFLDKLTISTPQKVGPNKIAHIYLIDKTIDAIWLPRFILESAVKHKILDKVIVQLASGTPVEFKISDTFKLFPNQQVIIDYLMENIYTQQNMISGKAGTTLNLQAGMGKTYIAAGIISRLNTRTLIIEPNRYLADQTITTMKKCFPTSTIARGTVENSQDIVVIVINTALKLPAKYFASYGLIIYDEVQTYCGQKRAQIFWKAQTMCILGLSATTNDRIDKFDTIYHKHMGGVIYAKDIPGFNDDGVKFTGTVTSIKYSGPPTHTAKCTRNILGRDRMFVPDMIKQLIDDKYRNTMIIDEVIALLEDSNANIFIFSESRQHLDKLRSELERRVTDISIYSPENPTESISVLRGGISNDERDVAIQARVILTTYGYSSFGVSIEKMNSIVFATPRRAGYKQICARILRRGSDTSVHRKIIDIVDVCTSLKSQKMDREFAYEYYGFDITTKKIKWSNIMSSSLISPADSLKNSESEESEEEEDANVESVWF